MGHNQARSNLDPTVSGDVTTEAQPISYPGSTGSSVSGWSPGDQPLTEEPVDSGYEIEARPETPSSPDFSRATELERTHWD